MRIIIIVLLFSSCSITKYRGSSTCAESVLKTIQFNELIEHGVKDDRIYDVVDLLNFYNENDSIIAKSKWDDLIDQSRFFEGQKTTLRTNYIDYSCRCKETKDTTFIFLQHDDISSTCFKLVQRHSKLIIVGHKVTRL